jgi:hypothetical protein
MQTPNTALPDVPVSFKPFVNGGERLRPQAARSALGVAAADHEPSRLENGDVLRNGATGWPGASNRPARRRWHRADQVVGSIWAPISSGTMWYHTTTAAVSQRLMSTSVGLLRAKGV